MTSQHSFLFPILAQLVPLEESRNRIYTNIGQVQPDKSCAAKTYYNAANIEGAALSELFKC